MGTGRSQENDLENPKRGIGKKPALARARQEEASVTVSCNHGIWREADIIALPKPNKDPSNPDNYRGISLTSIVAKLVEHVVANRLQYIIEPQLTQYQSGFRPHRSTIDQIAHLADFVSRGFNSRRKRSVL